MVHSYRSPNFGQPFFSPVGDYQSPIYGRSFVCKVSLLRNYQENNQDGWLNKETVALLMFLVNQRTTGAGWTSRFLQSNFPIKWRANLLLKKGGSCRNHKGFNRKNPRHQKPGKFCGIEISHFFLYPPGPHPSGKKNSTHAICVFVV